MTMEEPPAAALTLALPALETVTPAPMVSTPLVAIWRRLALLPLPVRRTAPPPDRVWVPLNSRLVKAPLVDSMVSVRPVAMPRPLVAVRRAPLAMVVSVSSVMAETLPNPLTAKPPVPDERRVEVAASSPAMVPLPLRLKIPLVESSTNRVGTVMVPGMFTVPAVPPLARVKLPNCVVLKVPSRLRVPPLAVMSRVPGGAVAPSLFQAPVREMLPPSTRTVPWFSKLPAMVSVLVAVSATKVP